jgi:RNA polymerase sigma factor (sigma-70 family)
VPAHPRSVSDLEHLGDAALAALARACISNGDPAERETASRCAGLLVFRHRDLVRTVIAAKVPAADADDVESAVLARFATAIYTGPPIHNPAGLLVRIAMWARADHHDRRRRSETTRLEDWDDAQPDPKLDGIAVEAAVEELLAPLSERQREVVCGRLLDGRSSAEVATRLGTTAGNVDVILHRALGKMREAAT